MKRHTKKKQHAFLKGARDFLRKYGISIGLVGCAGIAAVVIALTSGGSDENVPKLATPQPPVMQVTPAPNPVIIDEITVIQPQPSDSIKKPESAIPSLVKPVEGEILKGYARDMLVFSETLREYATHLAVDIQGELGQAVFAAADGEVIEVGMDKLMGAFVMIRHNDRVCSGYYGLSEYNVAIGDLVEAGDVIGAVGVTTLAESADGPHLHFVTTLDEINVDPQPFFIDEDLK